MKKTCMTCRIYSAGFQEALEFMNYIAKYHNKEYLNFIKSYDLLKSKQTER